MHCCDIENYKALEHFTTTGLPSWGEALESCREDKDGNFFIYNGEYMTRVNFCPFCGTPAPKQVQFTDIPIEESVK